MNWNEYKEYVKSIDDDNKQLMEEIEDLSSAVSALISQRTARNLTQRDLAEMCAMPQSTIARIETMRTVPKLDTFLQMLRALGLQLAITRRSAQAAV